MHRLYRDMQLVVVLAIVVDPRVAIATQTCGWRKPGLGYLCRFYLMGSRRNFQDWRSIGYTPGFHSTVELPGEKEYEKCDMSGALDSMNGGTSVVKLDKPGTRYFTCGTLIHCDQGMKIKIKVVASNESSSTKSPSTASVASSTPASASTSSASVTCNCASPVLMALFIAFGWSGMV
ncbi:uclacyanin-3-like [Aristolochia californica]|uniref:uclacyanin-3-like n=1 Tax=Aristolochia californica TaxID=171875 RepID=UPI0035D75243